MQQIQDDTDASVTAIAEVAAVIDTINEAQTIIASAVEEQRATAREMAMQVGEVAQAAAEILTTAAHLESVATSRH